MNTCFEEVKGTLGFGCMRLPMQENEVDFDEFSVMIDKFMEAGFNYFDTAHGYVDEKSETAIRKCLTSRYPRESYLLTDKLSGNYFSKEEDIRPMFESQLKACGVDYFDFYLMHALGADGYPQYVNCRAFEVAMELKKEGKIRHIGMSFHDKAEVLDKILSEHPEVEVVQLQFNYIDYENPDIDSARCYQVCEKYNKPVIVMEPIKGGSLTQLPPEAGQILDALGNDSYASYALRFCASFPKIFMVLSGMSNLEQMKDNIHTMKDFVPFSEQEFAAVAQVSKVMASRSIVPCTGCRYCTAGCPMQISIPDLFAYYNDKTQYFGGDYNYMMKTADGGKASSCIQCGKCEAICPQHLKIRELLVSVAKAFE